MSIQSNYTVGEDLFLYEGASSSVPVKLELRVTRQTSEHLFVRLVKTTPNVSEDMALGEVLKFYLDDDDITDNLESNPICPNWLSREPLAYVDEEIEKTYSAM